MGDTDHLKNKKIYMEDNKQDWEELAPPTFFFYHGDYRESFLERYHRGGPDGDRIDFPRLINDICSWFPRYKSNHSSVQHPELQDSSGFDFNVRWRKTIAECQAWCVAMKSGGKETE